MQHWMTIMRKLAIAAVLTVLASPAMADVCTNHGFTPGTMEYLECWRSSMSHFFACMGWWG